MPRRQNKVRSLYRQQPWPRAPRRVRNKFDLPKLVDLLPDAGLFWVRADNGTVMGDEPQDKALVNHFQRTFGTSSSVIRAEDIQNVIASILDSLRTDIRTKGKGIRAGENIIARIRCHADDVAWIKGKIDKTLWPQFVYNLVMARIKFEEIAGHDIKILHSQAKFSPDLTVAVNQFWLATSSYWERDASILLVSSNAHEFLKREEELVGWTPEGHDSLLDWALSPSTDSDENVETKEVPKARTWVPAKDEPLDDSDQSLQVVEDPKVTPAEMQRFMSHMDVFEEDKDVFYEEPEPEYFRWRSSLRPLVLFED